MCVCVCGCVCVCVCVCIYIYIYICTHIYTVLLAYMLVSICACMYHCMYVYIHICIYIYILPSSSVCPSTYTHTYMHLQTETETYTHTCAHIRIRTHTHAHRNGLISKSEFKRIVMEVFEAEGTASASKHENAVSSAPGEHSDKQKPKSTSKPSSMRSMLGVRRGSSSKKLAASKHRDSDPETPAEHEPHYESIADWAEILFDVRICAYIHIYIYIYI